MVPGILKVHGIKCDNENCEYENTSIQPNEYAQWIDKPCPLCGDTLLTQNDYNIAKLLFATTSIANNLNPDSNEQNLIN